MKYYGVGDIIYLVMIILFNTQQMLKLKGNTPNTYYSMYFLLRSTTVFSASETNI